jgi:protein involved in sex pheromone biosynthesis
MSGCSQAKEQVESQTNTDAEVATSLGDAYYSVINRETNPDRNNFYTNLGSTKDYESIGKDLEKLSTSHFSTDDYYMAEGQYLGYDDRQELLKRTNKEESDVEYPHSIQPVRGRTIDGIENPIMVNVVYEQDFYSDTAGETLAGASFAIVLDPMNADGSQLTKPMNTEAIRSYGEEIIPIFYKYIRSVKELKNVPVYICVYQSADKITSNVNGHYILDCYSENSIGSIDTLDLANVFITSNEAKEMDQTTTTEFETFKASLKELSIDAVGVVGYANFENKELKTLRIEVMVNVKTYGELEFFISKASQELDSAFTEMFDIQMMISTQDGMKAIIFKDIGQAVDVRMLY